MSMHKITRTLVLAGVIGMITYKAQASTFFIEGKEVTKGQAIRAKLEKPQTVVIKQDEQVLDQDKMTLKNKPK